MGNRRALIAVAVLVGGCVVAAGWLAGASSGSSQWVPPAAVTAALRQAGVEVRVSRPVAASWASTSHLYRGRGVVVAWYFAGTTGSQRSGIGPIYSSELDGGVSSEGVQVLELSSNASAAGYVSRIRPVPRPKLVGRAFVPLACSYRNLVLVVVGGNRVATAATLGRITRALETTAPRSTTGAVSAGACGQPATVRLEVVL